MATEIAENNAFAERVRASIEAGQKDYADFTDVAARLQPYGELPRPFVEALLESGKSHHVLYALANDTSEADRILSIKSPVKQALEVAKFASGVKVKEPAPVISAAPKPAAPKINGGGANTTPSLEDPSMSTKDWMEMREKQVAANPRRR